MRFLKVSLLSNGNSNSYGGSAWKDGCHKEPADKCTNQYLNVGGSGVTVNNANAIIGGKNFLLFPMWDVSKKFCSMGMGGSPSTSTTTTTANAASSCPAPASLLGGACGNGVGSCPTAANPYCSQHGYCGSTTAYLTNGRTAYNYCK